MRRIQVHTGARLHFGLILGNAQDGWQFGGLGLMVRRPGWGMTISRAAAGEDEIYGGAEATSRIARVLSQLRETLALPGLRVVVSEEIPFHTGLGGGTQLALGLASACLWLVEGERRITAEQLAQRVGRSERSAIGTFGFDHGGFLLDQGQTATETRVQRAIVPDGWRFVLVRPVEGQGMSGAEEQTWFGARPVMDSVLIRELSQLGREVVFGGVMGSQFGQFSEGLEHYGDLAGRFYSRAQGDIFSSPLIRDVVRELRVSGIRGAAQSSWGPGICIPAEHAEHAADICERLRGCGGAAGLRMDVSEPLNSGATLWTEATAERAPIV